MKEFLKEFGFVLDDNGDYVRNVKVSKDPFLSFMITYEVNSRALTVTKYCGTYDLCSIKTLAIKKEKFGSTIVDSINNMKPYLTHYEYKTTYEEWVDSDLTLKNDLEFLNSIGF